MLKYLDILKFNAFLTLNSMDPLYATRLSNTISTCIDYIHTVILHTKYSLVIADIDPDISDLRLLALGMNFDLKKTSENKFVSVVMSNNIENNYVDEFIRNSTNIQELTTNSQKIIKKFTKVINSNRKNKILKPYVNSEILKLIKM